MPLTNDFNSIKDRVCLPPQGLENYSFTSQQQGHDIHYVCAPSGRAQSLGTVIITHGYLEYSDLYYDTIKSYQELGYDVFMMDFFGFGRSGRPNPNKREVPSRNGIDEHVRDLEDFINQVVKEHESYCADKRIFMSSNSMGGQAGLLFIADNPDFFTGAILSSPLTHVNYLNLPREARPVAQMFVSLLNEVGFQNIPMAKSWEKLRDRNIKSGIADDYGLRDQLIGEIHRGNEDMHVSVPTWGWLQSTFRTSAKVMNPEFLKSIETPILWGTGGKDNFIDLSSHYEAVKHIPNVNHVFLQEGIHALWRSNNETLDKWWGHIEQFIETSRAPANQNISKDVSSEKNSISKLNV